MLYGSSTPGWICLSTTILSKPLSLLPFHYFYCPRCGNGGSQGECAQLHQVRGRVRQQRGTVLSWRTPRYVSSVVSKFVSMSLVACSNFYFFFLLQYHMSGLIVGCRNEVFPLEKMSHFLVLVFTSIVIGENSCLPSFLLAASCLTIHSLQ